MIVVWLSIFCLMQAAAQVFFKYGSIMPAHWPIGFIVGNIFGASSIVFLMLLYRHMNPHIALGLGTGGGFVCAQIALAALFRTQVSLVQYGAMTLIAVGMLLFCAAMRG